MPCHHVQTAHGIAIVCTRGARPAPSMRCICCGGSRDLKLCDGPRPTTRNPKATCDAPICRIHGMHVAPDFDFCPRCAVLPAVLEQHGLVETQAPSV